MTPEVVEAPAREGMGCIPHEAGVAFRVWAPHATAVHVVGDFNDWDETAHPMQAEEHGAWYADVPGAAIGQEYRFLLTCGDKQVSRIDPYAREVTNSVGNGVVHDPHFDWGDDNFVMPSFNELVIYEMHVGTFNRPSGDEIGTFEDVEKKFDYLRRLGVNAIQLMPSAEFAGDVSWGYNPAHIFAVESAYGGPVGLKQMVRSAHRHGLAVIMDVVYNHLGPSDLDLWQFDLWGENGKGGIYFYNDWRSKTPWGDTRPDYGRGEVRTYLHDNAMMWLCEYRMDGLRYDMTLYIHSVDASGAEKIAEGWSLTQWINREVRERFPRKIAIAEDLQNNDWITKEPGHGGAGFNSQWDAGFVHPIRAAVCQPEDGHRSMESVREALTHRYNLDAFQRVIYSESHDEVANGKARVPSEIDPDDPRGWFAQKRSTLAAAMVFTAPGIPMIFQGQEFLRGQWFDDTRGIDWQQEEDCRGIVRMYRDLIRLRLNRGGVSRGLCGQRIECRHVNEADKVIAFRRWMEGGPGDDVLVIANFANRGWEDYRIGLPRCGPWRLRFNSDATVYSEDFDDCGTTDLTAEEIPCDGLALSASLKLAPYSVAIFSQDP
ncbi:1,4-alpha-glucan branching enzyme GlgB [Pirellulimonas nuda]|uniref:1,4-alpha-glucan branching enzyme n=1 Tax=Pirellulimonas nuda TaxID=2528009 RepID=A0A518D716_9BACT|nr:alpha-amylase family glycosyl hydrolase [Pirellulimonas nuda]QDU87267.1 1,4-alpha-glucan branching enzyme GlgB [Pirellulimonas nuda]